MLNSSTAFKSCVALMSYALLLSCSVAIICVLYAVQPLLVLFAQQFDVSEPKAGSLMTLSMLPLAIAPLLYGMFLNGKNLHRVLKWVMLLLALTCVFIPLSQSFTQLQALRLIQGLLFPAALTAMTASIALSYSKAEISKKMSGYIGATIAGGFGGRALSAAFAQYLNWQSFFFLIAAVLAVLALLIKPDKNPVHQQKQALKGAVTAVMQPSLLGIYSAVFCMFFCFSALLNYLPFILRHDFGFTNTKDIGLVYAGYLLGALATFTAPWFKRKVPNLLSFISFLFVVYAITMSALLSGHFWVFFIAFTCFCATMFVIHASAAPLVNTISDASASVTNGVYVSFYYSGGAVGTLLPGYVYQHFGLHAFVASLVGVCVLGFGCTRFALRHQHSAH